MRIIIFTLLIVCTLAAEEDSKLKATDNTQKSDKLKEDVLQSIPTSYEFKYSTGDEGPAQLFREEYRDHDGTVKGKYGYIDPNGKLRVVQYTAGARGYSASGDIGPDSVTQNEAQTSFRNDPSVRAQNDVWNRAQSGNLGGNWGQSQPHGWSSVDPLWNVGALPKTPTYQPQPSVSAQPAQPAQLQPLAPSSVTQQPRPSMGENRRWDDKVQNNDNKWQKNEGRSGSPINWNTWNANQQTWTKQLSGGAQQWTSNINHEWPQTSVNSLTAPPSNTWSNQGEQPQSPTIAEWKAPNQGSVDGLWAQKPQTPTAGQWTQFEPNPTSNQWSQPLPTLPDSQPSAPTLPDLKERWTGISTGAQEPSNEQQLNKPLAGPPLQPAVRPSKPNWQIQPQPQPQITSNWQSQPQSHIQWGQPAPTISLVDEWSQRRNQAQAGQITQNQGQFDNKAQPPISWQSGVQYDSPPSSQWVQSPPKMVSSGEIAQPPTSFKPLNGPVSRWQQSNQANQAQFEQPQENQPVNPTLIGSNQWSSNPSVGGNRFVGQPFVHFRIDHTVDPNQPPLRYQYSY